MRKLSIRSRGNGAFEIGPNGHGPSVMVNAGSRSVALKRGKELLRQKQLLGVAADLSYRDNKGSMTRLATVRVPVTG